MVEKIFRAWDTKEKAMIKDFTNFAGWRASFDNENSWRNERYLTEQYTGKNDRENNPLYENDILQSFHFEERKIKHYLYHQIIWSDKYDGWFAKSVNSKTLEENGSIQLFVYLRTAIDVVLYSNIHESRLKDVISNGLIT